MEKILTIFFFIFFAASNSYSANIDITIDYKKKIRVYIRKNNYKKSRI